MAQIRLRNAKTKTLEALPAPPYTPRMYVCGPTVYDRAHIGNARSAVVFDQLFRLLREVYGAPNVTFVRNITDIDDKINARAAASGRPIGEITAETTQWYFDDLAALGVLEPTHSPRATAYVGQMIAMIEALIAKGHAYAAEGHVLFAVDSYERYGALSGRSVEDMIAGARVEVAPYKKNPMDFVLWKPSDAVTPGWESPWGRGRPGWHIECSAMAQDLLGDEFDIHGGGTDLLFPHHENECAQSCALGHKFARIWMHNEMLQVEGKKMSKSLGNFFTIRDLLDQGVPGEVIRMVFLMTHYRKPMDWTAERVREAEATLRKWYAQAERALDNDQPYLGVLNALCDDLNSPSAIAEMHQLSLADDVPALRASMKLMGLLGERTPAWVNAASVNLEPIAIRLAEAREIAMESKDFTQVDELKAHLVSAGVEVRMSKTGVDLVPGVGFDPAKLEGLL